MTNEITVEIRLLKIANLLAHNEYNMAPSLYKEMIYVMDGMMEDKEKIHDGFLELKNWLNNGDEFWDIMPVLQKHLIRHVERGIKESA